MYRIMLLRLITKLAGVSTGIKQSLHLNYSPKSHNRSDLLMMLIRSRSFPTMMQLTALADRDRLRARPFIRT